MGTGKNEHGHEILFSSSVYIYRVLRISASSFILREFLTKHDRLVPQMERWRRLEPQIAFRDMELVDLGAKPGSPEFLVRISLFCYRQLI